jgi:hypothetical protein
MIPTQKTRLSRMDACRSDLSDNGIDPDFSGYRARCDFARRNLEYFQFMLGYDAGLREVVGLLERTGGAETPPRRPRRVRPALAPAGLSPSTVAAGNGGGRHHV